MGKDPADNWFNNGINRWASKSPWRVPLLFGVLVILAVCATVLKQSAY